MPLTTVQWPGQNSRDRTRAAMSAFSSIRANRVGLPGAWGKIFTESTWTDVSALAALDITNSAKELSVVETPRLPTYRARLFALGACAVTIFQDSSFSASNFDRLWVGPGGGLFLAIWLCQVPSHLQHGKYPL